MAEGLNQSIIKQAWRRLCQINVPNKVKHFAWKACRNILATKENLWQRNITKITHVRFIGSRWSPYATYFGSIIMRKRCGPHTSSPFRLRSIPRGITWMSYGTYKSGRSHDQESLERTVMICWGIWKDRNEVRHRGRLRSGQTMTRSSLSLLEEFQMVNKRPTTTVERNHVVKWVPP